MLLKVGEKAPSFSLPDADMATIDLAKYQGQKEVTDFSDHEDEFLRQDCVLFGISRDDCMKHAEFRDKEGIGIELLSDMEGVVCKQYGVWQAKEVDGHRKFGVCRSTFIIDRRGIIRHALYNVNYKGHALEVLRLVKELNS